MTKDKTTHFGFEQITREEKSSRVADVFHSVAAKYDFMNDLMSGGLHRLWKQATVELAAVRPGQRVLDIAGGTGDLAAKFAGKVGSEGLVILADINDSMLKVGRDRLLDRGVSGNIAYTLADAEQLPFPDNTFDCITIAFGLRNVTDKDRALRSMQNSLKPGGRLLVLEFSKPTNRALEKVYDQYSFHLLPRIGQIVADDAESYRYLAESIRMHPDQKTLKTMMENAGLTQCQYHNMSGGIVALHKGIKT